MAYKAKATKVPTISEPANGIPISVGVRGKHSIEDKVKNLSSRSIERYKFIFEKLRPEREYIVQLYKTNYSMMCREFGQSTCGTLLDKISHSHSMSELMEDMDSSQYYASPKSRCNLRMICPECGYFVQRNRFVENLTRLRTHVEDQGHWVIGMTYHWKDTRDVMDCKELLFLFRKQYWRRRLNKKFSEKYPLFVQQAIDGFYNYEFSIKQGKLHHHLHVAWIVEGIFDEEEFYSQAKQFWKDVCNETDVNANANVHWERSYNGWEQWVSYLFKNPFHRQMTRRYEEKGQTYKDEYYLNLLRLELTKRKEGKNGRSSNFRLNGFLDRNATPSVKKNKKSSGNQVSHGYIHEDTVKKAHAQFFDDWFGNEGKQNAENIRQIL